MKNVLFRNSHMHLRSVSSFLDPDLGDSVGNAVVGNYLCEEVCVSWPLSLCIAKKIVTDECDVCIRFTNDLNRCYPNCHYGVMNFGAYFDVDAYIKTDQLGKKLQILNAIVEALKVLFSLKGWDFQPILEAKERLISCNFDYPIVSKNTHVSPSRKWSAQLVVRIDMQISNAYVAIRQYRKNEISHLLQLATTPTTLNSPAWLPNLEDSIKWLDDATIRTGKLEATIPD